MDESSGESRRSASLRIFSILSLFILLAIFPSTGSGFELEKRVKEFTLDNGLRTLVLERRMAPIFAAHMAFKVGSVEEKDGLTGAAHMLEHMLFKGTRTIGSLDWEKEKPLFDKILKLGARLDKAKRDGSDKAKIEKLSSELKKAQARHKKYVVSEGYSEIYSSQGGVGFNAGTSKDTTTYIIRLPANKLELWALIESDRMRDPVLREYYAERDVVMEERRRSYENRAAGKLYERFLATAFIAHPYGRPIIGWESDIALLPYVEVEKFLKTWYVPNNAVIAIVGDVKFEEVKRVITKYFGDIPAAPLPERIVTEEPPQGGDRRTTVEFDASPTFMMGFHKPTSPHPDDYVFDVIDFILSSGRTGRFEKEIVRNKRVAVSVGSWTAPGSRYPNLFVVSGEPMPPHTTQDVEKAVWDELERLKNAPVESKDLEKVINNIEADFIRDLESHYGMARLLAHYAIIRGDWRQITSDREKIREVTAEDIQRVARKYFTKDNLTVATLVPKKK
ncbi:Protease [hydrothermal vent metagenome]|uniref:Protease n=1 Tax=hydrothermal vent metagenome TaxID=652676 RepID=A0A3B1CAF1_9ZZZZ